MRVVSFDVFDTLLVRVQARPADLFVQLGEELAAAGLKVPPPAAFASAREQAELSARRTVPSGEVTLAEIYAALGTALGWNEAARAAAMACELAQEERSLKAVPAMLARVEAARATADAVWFLSDMYLPAAFIERVLRRESFFRDGDRLFVSGEHRASKHRGDLFARARALAGQAITDWLHIGDNPHADDAVPRAQGIRTEPWRAAVLNRYEQVVLARAGDLQSPSAASDRAKTARPSTAGQTSAPDGDCKSPAQGAVTASLFAGAMRRARLANPETDPARRVIWDTACDVVGPLVFGFVHWCLTEAKARGLRRLYFVARDGQLPQRVAERLATAWGFDVECRYLHGSRQAWHPAAEPGAETLRARALGYLRQEGLLDGTPWAMVDIGWHGNLQRSLSRLLAAGPLTGFYFGLVPEATGPAGDTVLGYWNQLPACGHGVRRLNHALWEIFLSADHGSVLGYRVEAGRVVPELREARNERALAWGLETLQAAVLQFTERWLEVAPQPRCAPADWLAVAREAYLEFYRRPTRDEAAVWGAVPFSDGQVEREFHTLTPALAGPLWQAIPPGRRPLYWWPEGALAQQACWPLRLFLALRDAKRLLTD